MKLSLLLPLPLALGLAFAPGVRAESLQALYELARAQDASWRSAKAQYDANLARADQASAGLQPTVNLTAAGSRSQLWLDRPSTERGFTTLSSAISATHPLYRPANQATFRQARWQVEQAERQLTQAGQDLMIRVSQAYFDVLAAQDTLTFVRAQKTAVSEQLASARRNFEVGTATITDTREAQARYDLVQAQEIAAENDLRVRKLALDTLVGKADAQPDPLAVPLALPTPQPADPEAWVRDAEASSPGILLAKAALEVAQLEVEKARAGNLPTVDVTGSFSLQRNVGGSSSSATTSTPKVASVGVSVAYPLFNGNLTQNRIRETLALEEKSRADLEATRRTVAQSVRSAYFGVVSGDGQVKALQAAEASSQSALEANRLGYQVGVRINIDVLNAQSQLFQTKRDLSVARYNLLLGHLRLRQANGTLTADDLQRLNALLAK